MNLQNKNNAGSTSSDSQDVPDANIRPESNMDPSSWFQPDDADKANSQSRRTRSRRKLFVVTGVLGFALIAGGGSLALLRSDEGTASTEAQTELTDSSQLEGTVQQTEATEPKEADTTDEQVKDVPESTGSDAPAPPDSSPQPVTQPQSSATYTVTYSKNCFSPSSITILAGDTIIFKNEHDKDMWPASNDHPHHTDYKEFDSGRSIPPGGSYIFTFLKKSTQYGWGYHDHNKPSCTGTIKVK